jgi:anaerobic ribonucleoside-triphosphate reductase activating protein
MENTGKVLYEDVLAELLEKYGNAVTCVCFMGGDANPHEVEHLSAFLREKTGMRVKTAWYSGKQQLPERCSLQHFDYIKLGPYVEQLGGLNCRTTNQRFYRIENTDMVDITEKFQR